MVSAIDRAKRALVTLLRALATAYGLAFDLTRDSPDRAIRSTYRKVSRRTHPDHGGKAEDQTALNNAFGTWEQALRDSQGGHRGRGQNGAATDGLGSTLNAWQRGRGNDKEKDFRFRSLATRRSSFVDRLLCAGVRKPRISVPKVHCISEVRIRWLDQSSHAHPPLRNSIAS